MRLALDLAHEAALAGEVPVGAVVIRGDEVIACGRNRREQNKMPCAMLNWKPLMQPAVS